MNGERLHVSVRWMVRSDLPSVATIEEALFLMPMPTQEIVRILTRMNCIGQVAEHEDRVVGYMIYELRKRRIDLVRLAVAADYRRRGVGAQMVAKLVGKLSTQRRDRIVTDVPESALAAQLFLRAAGFRAVAVMFAAIPGAEEGRYVFQRALPGE